MFDGTMPLVPEAGGMCQASKDMLRTADDPHSVVYDSFVLSKRDAYVKWAHFKLASMEDAREVANDALFKLYLRFDAALASESVNAFGWKILKDAIADALRKRDRQPCSPAGLAFAPGVRPVAGIPNEEIDQVAARMEVHRAVQALPDRQRSCVTLHYLLGYPVEEVADITGIKESTVRSHLATARTTLAGVLSELDQNPAHQKGDRT